MSDVNKNLGHATAYGYAKSKGYTGTEDDFATLMASYADVAEQARESAEDSEAWAVGERDGVPVPETDAQYHNNSKYYAEQASTSAGQSSDSAEASGASALVSEGHATGSQDGEPVEDGSPYYHNNALYYSQMSAQSADDANGYKTDAETAKTNAETAKTNAETAEGNAEAWAVGTKDNVPVPDTDPQYQNNAKYYAEQAKDSADASAAMTGLANQFDSTTAYAIGDYVLYDGTLYQFTVSHPAGAWTGTDAVQSVLSDGVSNLKSQLEETDDDVFDTNSITADATSTGWRLEMTGLCSSNASYKLVKYQVTAGDIVKVVSPDRFQFQSNPSVPSTGQNTYIIGDTYGSGTYYMRVPVGAIYLIISALTTDTPTASVANSRITKNENQIADIEDSIEQFATKTQTMPSAIYSAAKKLKINVSSYSGKKAFVAGKNLLPQFPALTDHGVTCTQNADGSITLSGTANGTASFQLTTNVVPTIGAGTYTLSARNPSAIGDNVTYINPSINGSYSGTIGCRLNSADAETTFTLAEDERITGIRIRISSGVTIPSNYKLYPQLEEGAEKTAFEAYKGSVTDLTSATMTLDCFEGYNYVCAQVGVTGAVAYVGVLSDDIKALDGRVTILEEEIADLPDISKKLHGKKVVCFGDSITGNYQPPGDYPSMIADITGATVYNAGFGGCCMSDNGQTRRLFTMCRLADAIVGGTGNYGDFTAQRNSGVSITYGGTSIDYVPIRLTMLESIDWTTIDYITIAYGTNDWNSNYGLDNSQNSFDTTTYIGAFRYAVETLLAKFPNLKVLVITPLWRWWDTNTGMPSEIHTDYIDSNDYAKGTGYKLWQYGDALVEAAKWYHIPVFDLYWNCMMFKQNRFEYFNTNDGTHPKAAGLQLMAGMISEQLETRY